MCAEMAEAQAVLGHDVTVICTRRPDRPTPLLAKGTRVLEIESGGLLRRRIGANSSLFRVLREEVRDATIVHSHGAWRLTQVYVRWACKREGVPYVHQPHGSFMPERLQHQKLAKAAWGWAFEKTNLHSAGAIHAECKADYDDIMAYIRHPQIYILPCGSKPVTESLDSKQFGEKYPSLVANKYILYIGRLDFHKGLDLLVSEFKKMSIGCEKINLAIVGPNYNNTKEKLIAIMEKLNIGNINFFESVAADAEKRALFENALCFILPSYCENFGITVLEALLAKCPVIVSSRTGWAELESEGAGIVFDPNSEGLLNAFRRFCNMKPNELAAMVSRGSELAAAYDWRAIASRQIEIYRGIQQGWRH